MWSHNSSFLVGVKFARKRRLREFGEPGLRRRGQLRDLFFHGRRRTTAEPLASQAENDCFQAP
jgi:hypothetical protein